MNIKVYLGITVVKLKICTMIKRIVLRESRDKLFLKIVPFFMWKVIDK